MSKTAKKSVSPSNVPLAIVGMGCRFPKADNLAEYWANIAAKVDGITDVPPTHWNAADYLDPDPKAPDMVYTARGGFLSPVDFNPMEYGIPPNAIEATDTTQLLGAMVTAEALRDAGYGPGGRAFDRSRVSCILGVTGAMELVIPLGARLGHPVWRRALKDAGVGDDVADDVVARISESYVNWQEASFPGLLGNVVAGRIANTFDLGGTNCVVDAACASALSAVHLATLELASGRSDMVVTGGMDTFNSIFMYMCFSKTPALSPTGDARPFSRNADGTILGEGLGVLVLKRLEDAERDGDRIYAVIRSMGTSSDGKGQAIYAPSSTGQARALRRAYESAAVTPETIGLLEAHGTGTVAGDAAEIASLTDVYRKDPGDPSWCALGSVKSQIGHTKAAAGAAGLIKAALALHKRVLPPTAKVEQPAEALEPGKSAFYVNAEKRPWVARPAHPRRAAVSAFGFGGSNFHCVLEEYGKAESSVDCDGKVQILAFAGNDPAEILDALNALPESPSWSEVREIGARSRAKSRTGVSPVSHRQDAGLKPAPQDTSKTQSGGLRHTDAACRLVLVVERDGPGLAKTVAGARAMFEKVPDKASWNTPDGAFFGRGGSLGKLAVVFPGQGSQYAGMLRDLACAFPQMGEALETADTVFAENSERRERLSDRIYPQTAFGEAERARNEEILRDTRLAQPALGAMCLGAMKVLRDFGVRPDLAAGHSYGELPALCAAGCFDERTLLSLSKVRGELMGNGHGDRGAMLAVRDSPDNVGCVLREEGIDVVIANKNAPNQAVLSGRTAEIERAAQAFERRKIQARRLLVSAAFHSALVADVKDSFLAALEEVEFSRGRIPVYANTTAEEYPAGAAEARSLLAGQLANPVEFVRQIDNMYGQGARVFLEVGPGNVLTGLVRSILSGRDHEAIALDSSKGQRSGITDLARVLAGLAALGYGVDLSLWDSDFVREMLSRAAQSAGTKAKKPLLTIPICGANYVKPRAGREARQSEPSTKRGTGVSGTGILPVTPGQSVQADRDAHVTSRHAQDAHATMVEALRIAQESMAALQRIQEQTAELHRRFLEGQEASQRSFRALLERQAALLGGRGLPSGPGLSGLECGTSVALSRAQAGLARATGDVAGSMAFVGGEPPESGRVTEDRRDACPTLASQRAETVLRDVIAEKTGYPAEMLEAGMTLDSDLGIDSIKRVEILSALQEKLPDAPTIRPEDLSSLQTIGAIVEFLASGAGVAPAESRTGVAPVFHGQSAQADSDTHATVRHGLEARATEVLLEVVAEKTGYPSEMLELGMSLDSDLGIDSIKRVEIFSALRERLPGSPDIKADDLGKLRTLGEIVEFLGQGAAVEPMKKTAATDAHGPARKEPEERESGVSRDAQPILPLQRSVLVLEQLAGRARPALRLASHSLIWIAGHDGALARALAAELEGRGFRAQTVPVADGAVVVPSDLTGFVLLAPREGADDAFVKKSFRLAQSVAPALRQTAKENGSALFATVSRIDGAFGLREPALDREPLDGALAGLVKTAAREWPEVACKAIDLAPGLEDDERTARRLADELLLAGPVEVGMSKGETCSVGLETASMLDEGRVESSLPFAAGDPVVISGGARGVTAEVALALAREFRPTLVLLGRTPEPGAEPDWLAPLSTEVEIKKALATQSGAAISPREVGERYRAIASAREIRRNIRRIEETGAKAVYRSVDIRDAEAVRRVVDEIRAQHGPIKGLIHGAGVLADRLIVEKTPEQFDRVYDTKVAGLRALLEATQNDPLSVMVFFSSSTGRFGRVGQADYAMANEILNKCAQREARRRSACRVVSVNWGPWNGGMVTPSLAKVFADEGIGMIDLSAGAEYLIREISGWVDGVDAVDRVDGVDGVDGVDDVDGVDRARPSQRPSALHNAVEVVVLGGATHSVAASGFSDSASGLSGQPPSGGSFPLPRPVGRGDGPSSTEEARFSALCETGLQPSKTELAPAFALEVDVERFPFLRSHVMDGHAVVPMAMMVEWMAHGALHANPGLRFHGFNDLRVLKGAILDGAGARPVGVFAGKARKEEGLWIADAEMRGTDPRGREIVHSRCEIVLAAKLPKGEASLGAIRFDASSALPRTFYEDGRLFHGPDLQGIDSIEGVSAEGIAGHARPCPPPAAWIRAPLRGRWLSNPLALDSAFQMMVLWTFERQGVCSLPCFVRRYRQFEESFPADGARVAIRVTRDSGSNALADIDFLDPKSGSLIARMDGYECVIDRSLNEAFRRNTLAPGDEAGKPNAAGVAEA